MTNIRSRLLSLLVPRTKSTGCLLCSRKARLAWAFFSARSLQERAGEGIVPLQLSHHHLQSLPSQPFPNTRDLMRDQKLQVIFQYAAIVNTKPAEDRRCTNKSMKSTSTIKLPTLAFGPINFVTSGISGEKKQNKNKLQTTTKPFSK